MKSNKKEVRINKRHPNILGGDSPVYIKYLWNLDKHCTYCRRELSLEESTIDHVIPRAKGGRGIYHNKVLCCRNCNTAKGNMLLLDFIFSTYFRNLL